MSRPLPTAEELKLMSEAAMNDYLVTLERKTDYTMSQLVELRAQYRSSYHTACNVCTEYYVQPHEWYFNPVLHYGQPTQTTASAHQKAIRNTLRQDTPEWLKYIRGHMRGKRGGARRKNKPVVTQLKAVSVALLL